MGPLRFLWDVNDLQVAIKHFVDATNLSIINKSFKRLNKLLNIDLKGLTNWINTNKILLNVSKTKVVVVFFKSKKSFLGFGMKVKLNGKRLYSTDLEKYLMIKSTLMQITKSANIFVLIWK